MRATPSHRRRASPRCVEAAWLEVSRCEDLEPSSAAGAAMAQAILRAMGHPRACVIDRRSVTEALHHVAHWDVAMDIARG